MKAILLLALIVALPAAAQNLLGDAASTADDAWWEDEPQSNDIREPVYDRQEVGERQVPLEQQEWGRGEADWNYLDDYSYYQDADPTDNLPRVDPDLWTERYQSQLDPNEPEVWSEPESLDDLTSVPPAEAPIAQPGVAPPYEPAPYGPGPNFEVHIADRDQFDSWYLEDVEDAREPQQRFYDSLSL